MNSKERGDIAVGQAINFFLTNGYEVCLPIGDKRNFDFVAEKSGVLKTVQVKFGGFYANRKHCVVGLRITGGNQSYHYAKKYKDDAFDLLFVYTEKGDRFLIPWNEVMCRNELAIENAKYRKYKV